MSILHTPVTLGALELPNRLIMAALTRCRADANHVPTGLMVEYYTQRASAGLIISEATMVMEGNSAFGGTEPGIYSQEQVAAWQKVTGAVHANGGRILLQLWHGGRACHPLLNGGAQPVAPSAIAIANEETHTPEGKKPYTVPRALEDAEIPGIIEGFRLAAANAKAAGFDGVQIHAANGYLIDEFLRDGTNHRTGPYGGPIANRARLLLEITDAVISVWGAGRVSVRISPLNSYNDMRDSDPVALTHHVAQELDARGIAFFEVVRGDLYQIQTGDVLAPARAAFHGALVANLGYTPEEAAAAVTSGTLAAVVFGRPFIGNPDFVARVASGAPVVESDPGTWYRPGAAGYTDYPALGAV